MSKVYIAEHGGVERLTKELNDLRARVDNLEARILSMKEDKPAYKAPRRPLEPAHPASSDTYDPALFPWRNTSGY